MTIRPDIFPVYQRRRTAAVMVFRGLSEVIIFASEGECGALNLEAILFVLSFVVLNFGTTGLFRAIEQRV